MALPAGAPLIPADLGSAPPAQGQAVVAVLVKPGQAPPALAPGASVLVVITLLRQRCCGADAPRPPPRPSPPISAVVTAVDTPTDQVTQGEIVSLQLPAADVQAVSAASTAGQVSLALVAPGG